MKKALMKKVNAVIHDSDVQSLYDYAWLVRAVMWELECESEYAEARIEHNGFSSYEIEYVYNSGLGCYVYRGK